MDDKLLDWKVDFIKNMNLKKMNIIKEWGYDSNKKIYLINKKYIVKTGSKKLLEMERDFLNIYIADSRYEKVIFYNKELNYIVYNYIEGVSLNKFNKERKREYLYDVLSIVNKYKSIDKKEINNFFIQRKWMDYIFREVKEKSKYMLGEENKTDMTINAIKKLSCYGNPKNILHGDLGVYNVIYDSNEKIKGIVDPRPIVGDSIYDFIFFIFSNINLAELLEYRDIIGITGEPEKKLQALITIVLYNRISVEKKHGNEERVKRYNIIWDRFIKEWR